MLFGNTPPQRPRGLLGMFAPGQGQMDRPNPMMPHAAGPLGPQWQEVLSRGNDMSMGQIPMPQQQAPMVAPEQANQLQSLMGASMDKKPGFFAEGGIGRMIAGGLGDVLLQRTGGQPIYQQHMMQQQALKQRQQMMQQQREADWQDWQRQFAMKNEWEKNNPTPQQPDDFERSLLGQGIQRGSPEWIEANRMRSLNFTDPTVTVNLPGGAIYSGPRSGLESALQRAGGGQPSGPVGQLKPVGKITPIGGASGNAGSGFPVRADYSAFKHAIIGQESGGRYGVPNAEGSGAMGVGQVMPDTGRVLAQRAGLPWRPDLMAGTGPDAQAYQDKITEGAAREAWAYGKGNPQLAAYYYFAGPDKGKWGPKTRQYGVDILRRIGRGGN